MAQSRSPRLLHEIFSEAVLVNPGGIAIEIPDSNGRNATKFTYREIDHLSNALAVRISKDIKKDQIVAIMLDRSDHFIYVSQLAILKAGGAYTCIDTSFPSERIKFIIEDSKTKYLLTDSKFINLDILLNKSVEKIDIRDFFNNQITDFEFQSRVEIVEDCLAYVIYTSGTTGTPKGVMIEHKSVVNLVLSDRDYFGLTQTDRAVQTSSTSYDSSVEEIWLAFGAGATMVVANDEVTRLGPDFGKWLENAKITVLCPPPTLLRMGICKDPLNDLKDLKLIYVGGEELPKEVVDSFAPGRWLENGYGPTECTITVTRCRIYKDEKITIGVPVVNNIAHILDDELNEVTDGELGELCISGISLARGYLNNDDLTREKFITHSKFGRIYRTGDLVKRLDSGKLSYHGRIDLQVKLRGYRVELSSIETQILKIDGVKDAACKIQEGKRGQLLIAYVIRDLGEVSLGDEFLTNTLSKTLPSYMIPNFFMFVEHFTISPTSGKLERSKLPEFKFDDINFKSIESERDPKTVKERIILKVVREILNNEYYNIFQNFFEAGGDSLAAAMVISELRDYEETNHLTVRNLYDHQTVESISKIEKRELRISEVVHERANDKTKDYAYIVSIVQLMWIFCGISIAAIFSFVGFFYFFPFFLKLLGIIPFIFLLPIIMGALSLLYIPSVMAFSVLLKKVLIGKYKAKSYPIWGKMYLKNWIVGQSIRLVPMNLIEGTIFKNIFLRMLGVKIGKNSYIQKGANIFMGGWDLLEIGDNVTIGREATLRTIDFKDGRMFFGSIKISDNATLETRSSMQMGSTIEDGGYLTGLSSLHTRQVLKKNETWEGVPASFKKVTKKAQNIKSEDELSPLKHAMLLMFYRTLMGVITTLPYPIFIIFAVFYFDLNVDNVLNWIFSTRYELDILVTISAYFVVATLMCLPLQALFARFFKRVRPGSFSRYSLSYISIWLKDRVVEIAGTSLSGTMFWPYWLRLSGMNIGKNCEISTIIDVTPELVTISDEVFFADGIYLGGPIIHQGVVTCDTITLSKNTFVGNHAIIPAGGHLPNDILLGICTVADKDKIRAGTSWFGHPAFELPNREVVELDKSVTHNPKWYRFLTRLFWESLRFFLPIIPTFVIIFCIKVTYYFWSIQDLSLFLVSSLHLITYLSLAFMASLIFIMKWGLLGKVKEGIHPLWSCWCSRWDFLYVAWASYAKNILGFFEGTLYLSWWLRLMGAKVGKRVMLGSGFSQVVDPDMLNLEDYATVLCLFQAHSFEDRVLKIAPVNIRKRSTVGNNTVVLYGADIGERSYVVDNSVVMKREKLLRDSSYIGCPTSPF